MQIGHISTFPPTRCGIATYAQDLIDNLPNVESRKFRLCHHHDGDDGFQHQATMSSSLEFESLAHAVNASSAGVIDLQHEFGIWGGDDGEHLVTFLEHCRTPIVATLHTTHGRNQTQVELLKLLCRKSERLVVLTDIGRHAIRSLVPECDERLVVIRHGIPDVPYVEPAGGDVVRFISPGFFRPDKGLETIIIAFSILRESGMDFVYRIVGVPQLQFQGQREYHDRIVAMITANGLQKCVNVVGTFLEREEMIRHIQWSDCGVIGYTDLNHSSSGIIPLILACGRPVISTPIEYSRATASIVSGLFLTSRITVDAMAETIRYVIAHRDYVKKLMPAIYNDTRKWNWRRAAEQYLAAFREASA